LCNRVKLIPSGALGMIEYVPTADVEAVPALVKVTDEIVSVEARPVEVNSVPANTVVVPYVLLASFAVIERDAGVIFAVVLAVVL